MAASYRQRRRTEEPRAGQVRGHAEESRAQREDAHRLPNESSEAKAAGVERRRASVLDHV